MFLNILQYKEFYVTNNYEAPNKYRIFQVHTLPLKNLGKRVHIIHGKNTGTFLKGGQRRLSRASFRVKVCGREGLAWKDPSG